MNWLLGVEIGGTKLQVGLADRSGQLVHVERTRVLRGWDASEIRDRVAELIAATLARKGLSTRQVAAVGVGFGGPVDAVRGVTITSHHVQGWDDYPLARWFEELWGWPAVVQNDADTAGLGEALRGAGQGKNPVFYITIGTGIGGGLIIDGTIYRGAGLGAGEIGHLKVLPRDPSDVTGDWYITEELASGLGLARRAQAALRGEHPSRSRLLELAHGEPADVTAEIVARAAAEGDPLAQSLIDRAVEALARAICHVVALLCPARIIIGGGVAQMGEQLLFEPLRRRVQQLVFAPFRSAFDIVPARLGQEVVLHGAVELARSLADRR